MKIVVRIVYSLDRIGYQVIEVMNISRKLGLVSIRNRIGNIKLLAVYSRDSIEQKDIRKRIVELREQIQITSQEIIILLVELLVLILQVVVILIEIVIIFIEVLFEISQYTYILLKLFMLLLFVFFEGLYQDKLVPKLLINTVTIGRSLILVPILYLRVSRTLHFNRMNITEFLD